MEKIANKFPINNKNLYLCISNKQISHQHQLLVYQK